MNKTRAFVSDDIKKIENGLTNLFEVNNIILNDIEKFIQGPSKRMRSLICLLYIKANNVVINEQIIELLISSELIHNASLMHDDVIDDAEKRRGDITFSKKYDSKISVLSGDYLLLLAVKKLLKINNNKILDKFLNTTEKMCNAEIKQYINRNENIDLNKYIDIIYGKTACLFQTILESAAMLSNIDVTKAGLFGKLYGILFQINNDEQEESILNDSKNGIKTVVDILGIEKTQSLKDNYKEEMRNIIKSLPNQGYAGGLEDLIKLL